MNKKKDSKVPIPTFETERLILKPSTPADAPAGQKYFNDFEVIKQISGPPWPYPENGFETQLRNKIMPNQGKTDWNWGLFLKENPFELIGLVSLHKNAEHNRGFWLGRPFWGRGLMKEALNPIMDYAFSDLGFEKIAIASAAGNKQSIRVREKIVGTYIRTYHHPEKSFLSNTAMKGEIDEWEITKEDWFNFRNKGNK